LIALKKEVAIRETPARKGEGKKACVPAEGNGDKKNRRTKRPQEGKIETATFLKRDQSVEKESVGYDKERSGSKDKKARLEKKRV